MHDDNSQTATESSMEGENSSDSLACCPEIIRELVGEMSCHTAAQPEAMVAVLLATAASAIGPGTTVDGRPVMFNVVVAHRAQRRLPWFDVALAPLIHHGLDLQVELDRRGAEGLRNQIEQREREAAAARNSVNPAPDLLAKLEVEINRLDCCLKPRAVVGRLRPREITQAAANSFDHGVTVVSIATDVGEALVSMRTAEKIELAAALNESWEALPLTTATGAQPGHLAAVIQTRRRLVDAVKALETGRLVPPVLCFEDHASSGIRIPKLTHEDVWYRLTTWLLEHRYKRATVDYEVSEDAADIFDSFEKETLNECEELPERIRPHVAWLGELAPRIALVVEAMAPKPGSEIDAEVARAAVAVARWLGIAHRDTVSAALLPTTDSADRKAAILAKIRLKAPVKYRELWRSFDQPRAEWFGPALQALIDAKKVAYDADRRLVACPEVIDGGAGGAN